MTNKADSDDGKHFATLRAMLAFHGYGLVRTSAADGPQRLYLEHQGRVMSIASIEHAAACLERLNSACEGLNGRT
jgi:hypothetical protein